MEDRQARDNIDELWRTVKYIAAGVGLLGAGLLLHMITHWMGG